MRLVSSSNDNKQYALDRENYTINFTLINMGSYIGFRSRQCWQASSRKICSIKSKNRLYS